MRSGLSAALATCPGQPLLLRQRRGKLEGEQRQEEQRMVVVVKGQGGDSDADHLCGRVFPPQACVAASG
ncbi:hypothetical protein EJB05_16895, partial [Eragrostis curvula]